MLDFFSLDGPFYKIMQKVWNLLVLNLLMVITSLPVITIGASQAAAFTVTTKMISSDETKIITVYFEAFKKNFKRSSIVWLVLLIISQVLIVNWYYLIVSKQLVSWIIVGMTVVTILVINCFQYVFFYISRFEDSLKQTLINILKLTFKFPIKNLILFLLVSIPILLMLLSPVLVVFGLYISLFIGMSFIHLLRTYLLLNIFSKIESK